MTKEEKAKSASAQGHRLLISDSCFVSAIYVVAPKVSGTGTYILNLEALRSPYIQLPPNYYS
jgi:hypothetical protein